MVEFELKLTVLVFLTLQISGNGKTSLFGKLGYLARPFW